MLLLCVEQVTNKLFQLSYIAEDVVKFATKMLLSAVDHEASNAAQSGTTEQRTEVQVLNLFYFSVFSFLLSFM
jgi:symplekin